MSDFDIVRKALTEIEAMYGSTRPSYEETVVPMVEKALSALACIEEAAKQAVDGLKGDIGNYVAKSERLYALRTALEGSEK